MIFRYTDIQNHQDPQRPFRRPYLIVRLINGDRHKDVISLVDSGADVRLFHSDIGRMLGIEIEAAPKLAFQGISPSRRSRCEGVDCHNLGRWLHEFDGRGHGLARPARFLRAVSNQLRA
jgi:hypothetical protein